MMPDDYIKRSDANKALYEWCTIPVNRSKSCFKIINDIPAADVEPIRHAQWIPGKEIARTMLGNDTLAVEYSDFHCSSCKRRYKEYVLIYRYCPNCGAKMNKEEDDGEMH